MKRKTRQLTRVKSVSFRANCAVSGRFEHVHVEASADVPEGSSPSQVLDDLKTFVAAELRRAKEGDPPTIPVVSGKFRV